MRKIYYSICALTLGFLLACNDDADDYIPHIRLVAPTALYQVR